MILEVIVSFFALFALELVLGVDNILVLAILSNRLPERQRAAARDIGLAVALVGRIALLWTISWLTHLTRPIFTMTGRDVSWRDLILFTGGLFLIWKSIHEMHETIENTEEAEAQEEASKFSFGRGLFAIIGQIVVLDMVFSLDSIITAVGVSNRLGVMIAAIVATVLTMMFFAGRVAAFINVRPTVKILALAFLLLVGVTLALEGFHVQIPKSYLYAAMGFALGVELLHMRYRARRGQKV